jgi:hypothetical protein
MRRRVSAFGRFAFCALVALYPAFAGIRYVAAGQSLQQALNEAILGDTIILQAGATFTGNFILPNKTTGTGWITIQSSLIDALPPVGQRVTPTHAPSMAKLRSPNGAAVIATATGAHHYRLIGLDIAAPAGVYTMNLILLGTLTETTPAQLPHSIVLDRLYIHGDARVGGKRGISLNSAGTMIMNSWISDIKSTTQDAQAIGGWNGTGPYEIVNNYLEASGENVMFGGATTSIPNVVPSDITLRQNHFSKPLSWKIGNPSYGGTAWMVKNLFELKNARRVVLEGNLFENCWAHAQAGFAIQLTVRTEDGNVPWAVVEDVVFRNNWMRNVAHVINIGGTDGTYGGVARRISLTDNVFETVGGRFLQLLNGANYVTADHNTIFHSGLLVSFDGTPSYGFVYRNNISGRGSNGIFGSGKAEGVVSLAYYAPESVVTKNLIGGASASAYPTENYFPNSIYDARFVNAAGSYSLASDSPYRALGTDGKDLGAATTVNTQAVIAGTGGTSIWNYPPTVTQAWRMDNPVTLGMKFRSDVAGQVTGVRFWKSSANDTGAHIGLLFTRTGTLLAQARFISETNAGWQQVSFASPVAIAANTTYVVAYLTMSGLSSSCCDFLTSGTDAPPLHALKSGVDGNNGLYTYGATPQFPVASRSANYLVDVMFAAQ